MCPIIIMGELLVFVKHMCTQKLLRLKLLAYFYLLLGPMHLLSFFPSNMSNISQTKVLFNVLDVIFASNVTIVGTTRS